MRADGSSRFGENNKYGYFPSVALGWNISNEDFMTNNNLFSNLKLRASWGQAGNQDGIPSNVSLASFVDSRDDDDTYPLDGDEVNFGTIILSAPYRYVPLSLILNGRCPPRPILVWTLAFSAIKSQGRWTISTKWSRTLSYLPIGPIPYNLRRESGPMSPDLEIINNGFEFSLDYRGSIGEDFIF